MSSPTARTVNWLRPEEMLAGMSLIAAFGSAPLDTIARQSITMREVVTGEADLGQDPLVLVARVRPPVGVKTVAPPSRGEVGELRHWDRRARLAPGDYLATLSAGDQVLHRYFFRVPAR